MARAVRDTAPRAAAAFGRPHGLLPGPAPASPAGPAAAARPDSESLSRAARESRPPAAQAGLVCGGAATPSDQVGRDISIRVA